jgi:BlaI family penicillinase repressor
MNPTQTIPRPTESELEILSILWEKGEASVAEVHQSLCTYKQTGYTTSLKLLQLMFFKGLVARKEVGRKHIYWATADQSSLSKIYTERLIAFLHNGSPARLAIEALDSPLYSFTKEELLQLQKAINEKLEKQSSNT